MSGASIKKKKILIVEDDYSSRLYLNKALEHIGATLLNANDGKEALDVFNANPDIDIILMDIQLPVLDGYTSTKMIRESGRSVVIIAQTAYGFSDDRELILSSGFDDYLLKPISQKLLVDKISFYLLNN
jgi:CheY-like chemotaxis protein